MALSNLRETHTKVARMPAADEQQLILQVKEGNQGAFRTLVERHMKQAYTIAHGFLGCHEHAEDAAQEAFVRAYKSIGSFRGDAEFSTWLYRIVTNVSLNRLKAEQRRDAREVRQENMLQAVPDNNPGPLLLEHRDHIERALHELPTMQRAVVLLRHFDGLSTRQVSRILGCSEGTVKTHLFRALQKLRKRLDYLKGELL